MKKTKNKYSRESILGYAKSRKMAQSCFPFDEETEVIKVAGKIFLLANSEEPLEISLKCNPSKAIELREMFDFVKPGYHLNKKHWITVTITEEMPMEFFFDLIDHSYEEVVKRMTRVEREELAKEDLRANLD